MSITGSVDDHFQKALGDDVWSRVKPGNKSSTPEMFDGNERPDVFNSANAMASFYQNYMQQLHQQVAIDGRHIAAALPYASPAKNPVASKVVKAKGIVYPEVALEPATPTVTRTYSSSSSGRSERTSSPLSKPDCGISLVVPHDARNRGACYGPANGTRVGSPIVREAKPAAAAANTMPVSAYEAAAERGQPLSLTRSSPPAQVAIASHAPPYTTASSSFANSPSRNPPAYSPQSPASSSTAKSPPSRHLSLDSHSPTDPSITVPVSVQT